MTWRLGLVVLVAWIPFLVIMMVGADRWADWLNRFYARHPRFYRRRSSKGGDSHR